MTSTTAPLLPSKDGSVSTLGASISQRGVRIVFKDLEYVLPSNIKWGTKAVVLKRMSGYLNDGEMTAIMGPSGCGKSMMMDVLAGRRSTGTVNGVIEYASRTPSKAFLRRITGYVEQFNTLLENLTVYEMLMYTAELTRHMTESFADKKNAVEALIEKLALGVCRDTKIGDPQLDRGISGGQAKRVNVGIALITQPRVLFMDEPISGLDSYTSNEIMQVVKSLVNDGLTLCATLHSPTPFTFNLFDKVFFLLRGHVVYFGNRASALNYFEAIAPESSISSDNDAEWLTDVVVKADAAGQAEQLASAYEASEIKAEVVASLGDIGTSSTIVEDESQNKQQGPVTPFWFAIGVFLRYRSWKNFKHLNFWVTRIADKVVLSILAGSVYWGLGDDFTEANFTNIVAVFAMWSSFAAAGASVYVPSFVMDRWLFYREHRDGLYRVITYFLVRMVEELIVAAVVSIMVTIMVWYAVQLKGSIALFFFAFFGNYCCSLALAFLVSNLAPNMDAATGGLPSYLVSLTFFCGFFIRPDDIPVYLVWYSKIDFMKYSLGAFAINHFNSCEEAKNLRISAGAGTNRTVGALEYFDLDGKDEWEYTGANISKMPPGPSSLEASNADSEVLHAKPQTLKQRSKERTTVSTKVDGQKPLTRLPKSNQKLPFTLSEIRKAIPKHCFERSVVRSFSYFFRDVFAITVLVYASTFIDGSTLSVMVKYGVLWPMYWTLVGIFGVGLWIVSHECGHGAFSEYNWLNDLVGLLGHSILGVPYFSWKHSHRRHHANTGSMTRDEAFIPSMKDSEEDPPLFNPRHTAVVRLIQLILILIFGFPLYLIMNFGGREYKGWANHYNPWSPVFLPKERFEVFLSDLGLAGVAGGLFIVGYYFGFGCVLKTYIIPYFVVHFWLVLITFLHHSHPSCPHYDDQEWQWLKGALSTIDRSFGILDVLFHRITDTHVLHHLFSQIPHYHAVEATEAIKPVLGAYYKQDKRNWVRALWEDYRDTRSVAPDHKGEGVMWYQAET